MIYKIKDNPTKTLVFLLIVLGLFYIPGLGVVHLFDWDEINFAEASREMILTGDYLHVRSNFHPFWEKPPLFMWLQVIMMKIFGVGEFAARLPNALFGLLYIYTFYLIGKKHFSATFGILWGVIFSATLLPHVYFRSGVIDPVFNYFIFLSIYFMILALQEGGQNKWALLSGVMSGLSILTKGPVGFLLLALTLFFYLLFHRFKPFPSWKKIALFVLALSSTIFIWLLWEYLANGYDNLVKFILYQLDLMNKNVAGHAQPFYYHFFVVLLGCFPISIIAIKGFWVEKDQTALNFRRWMLTLFWVVLILFSIVKTKIIHYSSMTYIPLAFIAAQVIYKYLKSDQKQLPKWMTVSLLIHGVLIGLAMMIVTYIFMSPDGFMTMFKDQFILDAFRERASWMGWEYLFGLLFIITVIFFVLRLRKSLTQSFMILLLGLGITFTGVQLHILPKIESYTQGPFIEFCERLAKEDCYVETQGFKSYAHYLYAEVSPEHAKTKDMSWIFSGEVDKPVYIITKTTNTYMHTRENFKLQEEKGGFRLYKRIDAPQ